MTPEERGRVGYALFGSINRMHVFVWLSTRPAGEPFYAQQYANDTRRAVAQAHATLERLRGAGMVERCAPPLGRHNRPVYLPGARWFTRVEHPGWEIIDAIGFVLGDAPPRLELGPTPTCRTPEEAAALLVCLERQLRS